MALWYEQYKEDRKEEEEAKVLVSRNDGRNKSLALCNWDASANADQLNVGLYILFPCFTSRSPSVDNIQMVMPIDPRIC